MKKVFFHIFIACLLNLKIYSQLQADNNIIINQILQDRVVKVDQVKLLSQQFGEIIETHLDKLKFSINKKFGTFNAVDNQIILTQQEGKQIIDSIRKNYNHIWSEKNIKNIAILNSDDTRTYMKGKQNSNTLLLISKPVFIRKGTIAIVYFGNFIYSKMYFNSDLCFYKKRNGVWKRWIEISEIKE